MYPFASLSVGNYHPFVCLTSLVFFLPWTQLWSLPTWTERSMLKTRITRRTFSRRKWKSSMRRMCGPASLRPRGRRHTPPSPRLTSRRKTAAWGAVGAPTAAWWAGNAAAHSTSPAWSPCAACACAFSSVSSSPHITRYHTTKCSGA